MGNGEWGMGKFTIIYYPSPQVGGRRSSPTESDPGFPQTFCETEMEPSFPLSPFPFLSLNVIRSLLPTKPAKRRRGLDQ